MSKRSLLAAVVALSLTLTGCTFTPRVHSETDTAYRLCHTEIARQVKAPQYRWEQMRRSAGQITASGNVQRQDGLGVMIFAHYTCEVGGGPRTALLSIALEKR